MSNIDTQVDTLRTQLADEIDAVGLEVSTRYTLGDAIREGSTTSNQAYNWTNAEGDMCALSAAVIAAKARGYMA